MPFSSLRPSLLLASTCCISVLLDVTPGVNTCLFIVKLTKPSAAVHTAPRLPIFIPLFWLGTCQSILTQNAPVSQLCKKMQTVMVLETLILVLRINVGDAMLSNPLRCPGTSQPGTRVRTVRLEACDAFLGIREGFLALLPPHNAPGNRSIITLRGWPGMTTSCVFKKRKGKMSFYKLFKYYILNSGTGRLFLIIGTPDGTIVTPVTTCQGRDHIVTIRSGKRVLEVVNVHLEPDVDAAADGTPRTPSRIDRAFIHVLMAEARDFHCYSHVSDHLGERSILSDHDAVRIVVQKPTNQYDQIKRVPSWMSKHHVFCSIGKRISDGHQYPDDSFAALADFKVILEKVRKQTHQELSHNTPGSLGAKLLIASTALRAYNKRHDTLMRCCAAWEPIRKCVDQCSFECIDFMG